MPEKRLVVVISGGGRNLQALLEHCAAGNIPARVAAVISNRADAGGIARAAAAGVPTQVVDHTRLATREAFDRALGATIATHTPDVVALAGFMRVLGAEFIAQFHGRLLNIHPSLLPKYPGLKTHERALANGDREHGASVHFVTPQVDGGPVAIQGRLRVQADDTPQTLAQRVMQDVELKIYPQAVAWLARGDLRLEAERVAFGSRTLAEPLELKDVEPAFR